MTALAEALAKRGGWCPLCRQRIVRGTDYVRRVDRLDRWCHSSCATSYERLMAENEEADDEIGTAQ